MSNERCYNCSSFARNPKIPSHGVCFDCSMVIQGTLRDQWGRCTRSDTRVYQEMKAGDYCSSYTPLEVADGD